MDLIIKLFQFILSISILVILHEMGHFFPAIWFRTRAEKFFLFFDPWFSIFSMKKIQGKWKFKFFSKNLPDTEVSIVNGKKIEKPINIDKLPENDWRKYPENTKYGIGWLPFGGYVKIAGMVDESMDTEQLKKPAQKWEFRSKPAWQRLIIMLGGVTVNFFLAWIIFTCLTYTQGDQVFNNAKNISIHYTDTAKKMGFQDGDRILFVDGKSQSNPEKLSIDVLLSDNITVLRNGKQVTFNTNDEGKALVLKSDTPKSFLIPQFAPIVGEVVSKTTIESGLKKGDLITKINGIEVHYFDEISPIIKPFEGKTITLNVLRNNTNVELSIPILKGGIIGFSPKIDNFSIKKYTLLESIPRGFTKTIESLTYQIKQFKLIFNKKIKGYKKVSGPIGIIKSMNVETDGNGHYSINWVFFWNFTGMFSIWLAFLNLIPIPGLDGGHVLFTLWEIITRKPVPQKILEKAQMIGVVILLGLMVLIFGNDIFKLIFSFFNK